MCTTQHRSVTVADSLPAECIHAGRIAAPSCHESGIARVRGATERVSQRRIHATFVCPQWHLRVGQSEGEGAKGSSLERVGGIRNVQSRRAPVIESGVCPRYVMQRWARRANLQWPMARPRSHQRLEKVSKFTRCRSIEIVSVRTFIFEIKALTLHIYIILLVLEHNCQKCVAGVHVEAVLNAARAYDSLRAA